MPSDSGSGVVQLNTASWGSTSYNTSPSVATPTTTAASVGSLAGTGDPTVRALIMEDSDATEFSLDVIDAVFGRNADLYNDILGISVVASIGQIQDAYLARRDELFRELGELDCYPDVDDTDDDELPPKNNNNNRNNPNGITRKEQQREDIERKLDAVVGAVRILRDPELRLQYDEIRKRRLLRKQQLQHVIQQQQQHHYQQQQQQDPRTITPPLRQRQQQQHQQQQHQQHAHLPPVSPTQSNRSALPTPHATRSYPSPPPNARYSTPTGMTTPIRASSEPRGQQASSSSSPLPHVGQKRPSRMPSPSGRVREGSPPHVSLRRKVSSFMNKVKPEAIVRDSNYVGALMRANSATSSSPPQLPIYLDSDSRPYHQPDNGHTNDNSIVSGLTNPTAWTGVAGTVRPVENPVVGGLPNHNHYYNNNNNNPYLHPSDYTTTTNGGSSFQGTEVSGSIALNSYGPVAPSVMDTTDEDEEDDRNRERRMRSSRQQQQPSPSPQGGGSRTSKNREEKSQRDVAIVTPPSSSTKNQKMQKRLDSNTTAVIQTARLKSSESNRSRSPCVHQDRPSSPQNDKNKVRRSPNIYEEQKYESSRNSYHEDYDESTVSTAYTDDKEETVGTSRFVGSKDSKYSDNQSDYDDDYTATIDDYTATIDDDISVSESLIRQHEEALDMEHQKDFNCLDKIRFEILGAIDDTTRSFEQIFSAFTLRPAEIDIVAGRIDKAKREIVRSYKKGGLSGSSSNNNKSNKKGSTATTSPSTSGSAVRANSTASPRRGRSRGEQQNKHGSVSGRLSPSQKQRESKNGKITTRSSKTRHSGRV